MYNQTQSISVPTARTGHPSTDNRCDCPAEGRPEVLVIGAGPAGLAVSAGLKSLHVPFDLVDAHGQPGGAYARMYPDIVLSSPADYLSLPGMTLNSNHPNVTAVEF